MPSADAEYRKGTALLDRALEIARRGGGARFLADVQAWLTSGFWWLGRNREDFEAAREAMALAVDVPGDPYAWFKAASGVGCSVLEGSLPRRSPSGPNSVFSESAPGARE